MDKITLNTFLDLAQKNSRSSYVLKEALSDIINNKNEENEDSLYWIKKNELLNNTHSLFNSAVDLLTPIKRYSKPDSIQNLAKNFVQLTEKSIFDFNDLLNTSNDISTLKNKLNSLLHIFSFLGNYTRIDGFKNFNLDKFFDDEHFSQKDFENLLTDMHHDWSLSPKNIIKLFSKDALEYDAENPPKYLSLRFLQTNIIHNIDAIFTQNISLINDIRNNSSLSDEEKEKAVYNQENIFAKIFHNGFSRKVYSSFSHDFSFIIFPKSRTNDILYKIFPISFSDRNYLENMYKDLKSNSYTLKENENVKKPFSEIAEYIYGLDKASQKDFFQKYPSLINFLELNDLDLIKDVASSYFNNFESKFLKDYQAISEHTRSIAHLSISDLKKQSAEFFLQSISSRFSQSHLDKFESKDIPSLFETLTYSPSLKIKKSKYLLKYIHDNKFDSKIVPFLTLYDSKFNTVEKAIDFFKLDNNIDFSHYKFANLLNHELDSQDNFRSYKKSSDLKNIISESVFAYINDETKDLNILKNLFITDYRFAQFFFQNLPMVNLDKEFNPKSYEINLLDEGYDESLKNFSVSISLYTNFSNKFLRYQEMLKFCLDTELCFFSTHGQRNLVYIKEENYLYPHDEETIFSKFHLLNKYFEILLKFSEFGNSYHSYEKDNKPKMSDFHPRSKTSPLKRHVSRTSSVSRHFQDLPSPININHYISYPNFDAYTAIMDSYNKKQRTVFIDNQFNNIDKVNLVSIKKKI